MFGASALAPLVPWGSAPAQPLSMRLSQDRGTTWTSLGAARTTNGRVTFSGIPAGYNELQIAFTGPSRN